VQKILNDALMGILRVRDLKSPPYVSTEPSLNVHKISTSDQFVIVASDGLFDFFSNEEAVNLVESYILSNPDGDPAKFLIEELVTKAADSAGSFPRSHAKFMNRYTCFIISYLIDSLTGFTTEELMNVPDGRRRKYHDDVTVMVIILGMNKRTSKASICI
jgi:pyruvate dehydrogenase phosphatase